MYDDELNDEELELVSGGQDNYIEKLEEERDLWKESLQNPSTTQYEKQYAYKKIDELNSKINELKLPTGRRR